MRKRDLLAAALSATGISHLALRYRPRLLREFPILSYHRVIDLPDSETYPFNAHLISCTPADFDWQMRLIRRYFTPVGLADLSAYLQNKAELPTNPIAVTFDDGYNDNYHQAFPILKRYGIPATIFVTTDYIDQPQPFWFERLAYVMLQAPAQEFYCQSLGQTLLLTEANKQRRELFAKLVEQLKNIPNKQRLDTLQECQNQLLDEQQCNAMQTSDLSRALSSKQILEMAKGGIEIGSHSCSHPILSRLNDSELSYELAHSKQVLENLLGRSVDYVAYPNGQDKDFNAQVVQRAQSLGYRLGINHIHRTNRLVHLNPFSISRFIVNAQMNHAVFKTMLGLPEVCAE